MYVMRMTRFLNLHVALIILHGRLQSNHAVCLYYYMAGECKVSSPWGGDKSGFSICTKRFASEHLFVLISISLTERYLFGGLCL